ncbi:MAG: hypothetical protein Q8P04_00195 [bacterium]|nr:hypothetical protein [bacterium]
MISKPKTVPEWIILLAVTGIVLTSPYGGKVLIKGLKYYLEERARAERIRQKFEAKNISQALYRLKKRKLIRVKKKGDKVTILLTEKGRIKKLAYDIERIKIPKPQVWDKQWRFLIFDIPEDRRESRDAFRARLKDLGLIQFQQSVWIYPYPCEQEIGFLAEYFKVNKFLTILTVKVQNDEPLRSQFKRFNLK